MKEFYIDADVKNLHNVLSFIDEELKAGGCDAALRNQISMAVEEIFVNIAHYAYNPAIGSAVIRICVRDDVRIEFEDKGKAFNPLERADPDITKSLAEREIGGLGIYMVKQFMDSVTYRYENGKNILVITKEMNKTEKGD